MLDLALRYYGFDWAAMVFTFMTIYRLGHHKRDGFIYGLAANVCWMVFGVMAQSIANPIANTIFLVLNLRGYRRWSLTHDTTGGTPHATHESTPPPPPSPSQDPPHAPDR